MKIAVVNDLFYPKVVGGTERFLKELTGELAKKNDVFVVTSDVVKGETGFPTYKIRSSPFRIGTMNQFPGITVPWLFFNTKLRRRVMEIYAKEKPDVVYVNNAYHLSFAPVQEALVAKIPFLLDVHDYWPICFSKDKFKDDKAACNQKENWRCSVCMAKKFSFPLKPIFIPGHYAEAAMKKELLSQASATISHSAYVQNMLRTHGYESSVIPYPYLGPIPRKSKRNDGTLRVLFAGRLDVKKGADLVLRAARELLGKNVRIDVLGDGPFKKLLDRPDLGIYVHGFLSEERWKFFAEADVFLAPSRWPEPFGMVALEAAAHGAPVVTLKQSGGLAELVEGWKIGKAVEEGELASAILNAGVTNGRRCIAAHDKKKIFGRYARIMRDL